MDCHVATIAVHVSIEDYHVAINADHVSIEDCHVAINADHVSIEDYHVAINADHVAIDGCHVMMNAGQTHHIFSAQAYRSELKRRFLRVGLTTANASNASYWNTQCLKEALRKVPKRDSSYCTHT